MSINVPGWVYKRYAYGDISETELHELEKMAESLSSTGIAGAKKVVADKSNNLQKVMKEVPAEDRDDVLRALRQMKKQASGCATHSKPSAKKRLKKSIKKQADFGTAAALMGGAALAPIAGHLAMRGINAMSRKSPQQMQQDLRRILQIHPDIGRPTDRRVQMAYATLVRLNPEYAEDPLIAGPLLKQIVDSRMDPANPMSASYMDPGMAKQLSEARKSHVEGMSTHGRGTLAGDMRSSIMGGVQNASGALMKNADAPFTKKAGKAKRKQEMRRKRLMQIKMKEDAVKRIQKVRTPTPDEARRATTAPTTSGLSPQSTYKPTKKMSKSYVLPEKSQHTFVKSRKKRFTYPVVPPKKPFLTDEASIARKANLIEKAKAARTARKVLSLGKL